ncbi:hypothetical protein [Mycolicibacterium goodii]|uniref:hypothetical protein n=1 Tax=Mycolicibacterium goodii TaxID=134601 RepID=UPI0012FF97BF
MTPDPDAGRESIAAAFAIAEQVPAYRTVLDAVGILQGNPDTVKRTTALLTGMRL